MPTARRISRFLAAVIVTAAAASLCLATGCGSSSVQEGGHPTQQRTLQLARAEFSSAAEALLGGDRAAFDQAVPVGAGSATTAAARKSLAEVFDALSPLPWRTFSFAVTPADPGKGIYRIEGSGQLGAAGPPDRLAVDPLSQAGAGGRRRRRARRRDAAERPSPLPDGAARPRRAAAPRPDRARRPLGARAGRAGAGGSGAGAAAARGARPGHAPHRPHHRVRLARGRPRRAGAPSGGRPPRLLLAPVTARRRRGVADLRRRRDGAVAAGSRDLDGRRGDARARPRLHRALVRRHRASVVAPRGGHRAGGGGRIRDGIPARRGRHRRISCGRCRSPSPMPTCGRAPSRRT